MFITDAKNSFMMLLWQKKITVTLPDAKAM